MSEPKPLPRLYEVEHLEITVRDISPEGAVTLAFSVVRKLPAAGARIVVVDLPDATVARGKKYLLPLIYIGPSDADLQHG